MEDYHTEAGRDAVLVANASARNTKWATTSGLGLLELLVWLVRSRRIKHALNMATTLVGGEVCLFFVCCFTGVRTRKVHLATDLK